VRHRAEARLDLGEGFYQSFYIVFIISNKLYIDITGLLDNYNGIYKYGF